METLEQKLLALLKLIEERRYGSEQLETMSKLQNTIASDIGSDVPEAMALLGYLLRSELVEITTQGILVNNNKRVDIELLKSGIEKR